MVDLPSALRHRFHLSDLDAAAVFRVRAPAGNFDSLIVIRGRDGEVSADHLFRLRVRAVGDAEIAVGPRYYPAALVAQLGTADELSFIDDFLSPGDVFTDDRFDL